MLSVFMWLSPRIARYLFLLVLHLQTMSMFAICCSRAVNSF